MERPPFVRLYDCIALPMSGEVEHSLLLRRFFQKKGEGSGLLEADPCGYRVDCGDGLSLGCAVAQVGGYGDGVDGAYRKE